MIYRSFDGLRYEVEAPSRFVFRLGAGCSPMVLEFTGKTWSLKSGLNKAYFLQRQDATEWLADRVAEAEAKYETCFTFAHLLEEGQK